MGHLYHGLMLVITRGQLPKNLDFPRRNWAAEPPWCPCRSRGPQSLLLRLAEAAPTLKRSDQWGNRQQKHTKKRRKAQEYQNT